MTCHQSAAVARPDLEALVIRPVSRDDDAFWSALAEVVQESFDAESFRPVEAFRHLCPISAEAAPAFYPQFLAVYDDQVLVGFAALEYFLAERVWYLWYMATRPESRSRGVGAALLEHIQQAAQGLFDQPGFQTVGIVAECEAPSEVAEAGDPDVRRVAFYERHGFRRLDVEELAPPFGVGEQDPVPYWLLFRPVDDAVSSDELDVRGILRRMFGYSRLNGPNDMARICEAFSVGTMGRPPRGREATLRDWNAIKAELVSAPEPPESLDCTWLTPAAETHFLPSRGYGEIAVRPIPAGSVVGILGGFVVNGEQLARMPEPRRHRSIEVDDDMYLVARELPEIGDLFNHSCEPTCGLQGSSLVVAMRDIAVGEELTFDYAMCDASDYDEFVCLCGEASCRGVVTGSDWRSPVLQAKYDGWFSPYLVKRIAALPRVGEI